MTDCRLRAYDAGMKVRLSVFDTYESRLLELKALRVIDLEFKDAEGNFEEYNSSWIYLRAVKYEEGMDYDWSRPDSFPSEKIRILPKEDKVEDLEQRLSEALSIPATNLIIFLRHEHGYNSSVSTEFYNMEWRRPKLISEASKGIEHGKVLFCEEGEHGAKFDTFKW